MDIQTIKRRDFVKSQGLISAGTYAAGLGAFRGSCESAPVFNKREAVLNLLTSTRKQDYIPSGFFVHFGEGYQWGDVAVARHLEYFKSY